MAEEEQPAAVPPGYDALGEARRLMRTIRAGALATLEPDGAPFSSLVSLATLPDGSPLLLLSRLAAHTRHLDAEPRCSLLLAQGGKGDPLAHPRLTLVGQGRRLTATAERALARRRFLARQPKAALYAAFPDFGFFALAVATGHLNGGFARAARFPGAALATSLADAAPLLAAEADAIDHLNADHRDALALYARVFCKAEDGPWMATGLDPDGLDLASGDRTARLVFPTRVTTPGGLRGVLVELAARARHATS